MNIKILGLLLIIATVVIAGWADLRYFGPAYFTATTGSQNNHSDQSNKQQSPKNSTAAPVPNARVLIDFANSTRLWFNETDPPDWNYYNVTNQATNGELVASWNGVLGSHFVFSILGSGCQLNDYTCGNYYWSLWIWNPSRSCWISSIKGIDLLKVSDTQTIGWYWNNYHDSLQPQCT